MSFKATFNLIPSKRFNNHISLWSLTLKCTNVLFGETVDIGLFPSDGSQPWYFRNIKFKAGQSYIFDYDTVDWKWRQDDYAAILGPNNSIVEKFLFHMKEYGPGECPECHGTHKCKKCNGKGYVWPPGRIDLSTRCDRCNGNGICITCDVPYRKPTFQSGPSGLHPF